MSEWLVVSEEVLQALVRHPGPRVVVGGGGHALDEDLLAGMVSRWQKMGRSSGSIERLKFDAEWAALSKRESKLRKLGTPSRNLSTVNAGLLASAANRLVWVQFCRTMMTVEQ